MESHGFSAAPAPSSDAAAIRAEGAWRVVPLEGTFEIVYEDARGVWSSRIVDAREMKLGPGRTLLGGFDHRSRLYRGFRADRIRRLSEPLTGLRIETGILDHLLDRAEAQRRRRAAWARSTARSRGSPRKAREAPI